LRAKIFSSFFVKETEWGFERIEDIFQGHPIILVVVEHSISDSTTIIRRYVYYSEFNIAYKVDVQAAQTSKRSKDIIEIFTKAGIIDSQDPVFALIEQAIAEII
jgi:hypothetical protein